MKKVTKFSILALILLFLGSSSMNAQTRRTTKPKEKTQKSDKYFDESGGFTHKLWYGGTIALNYIGGYDGSRFYAGLTPMVGYKITPDFSVGPRIGFLYNKISFNSGSISWTDYTAAAFARYKFLQTFFLHAEYEYANLGATFTQTRVYEIRSSRDNIYIGAGYHSGGVIGFETSILYNVNLPSGQYLQSPLDIRAGFTYNF